MNMSLGRRTASGILFTPTGLSFTFTEKSTTTNTEERNRNRRRRLADTNSGCKTCERATRNPEESTTAHCPKANVGECTPRKSKTQSYKVVDAMASERTPRGGARRKLPRIRKASETELCATLQSSEAPASHDAFQASDVPWEDDNVVDENHGHIYDPYRDMRMDIDYMSYEELLALGERIGTVSTAISEEDLSKYLKRSKYTIGDCVTCSICQEEFVEGDELGEVACRHVYHATCIEQWLKSKNWCPLCKGSACLPWLKG